MKIKPYTIYGDPKVVGYTFECPGCGMMHAIHTDHPSGYNWQFNGDVDKPTFNPSLLVHGVIPLSDDELDRIQKGEEFKPVPFTCHSFIRNGNIEFLGDCTHHLKGQTIPLPERE